ncbi:MAG: tyrosine-type recombinase/integrase, partial [Patulibacter sp.]|nr:tyrosine-type recombinase/integrase [Patulibacter sp.]
MSTLDATAPRYDARGRRINPHRRSRRGHAPRTKGKTYPPRAYKPAEVQQLLQATIPTSKYAGVHIHVAGLRLRTLIVVLWRTGMRIAEALDLEERDLDRDQRQITIRSGKGAKRRVVGMDDWG